ncbi:hypothetical protein PhaeoP24_04265 (plasmid) [Phaeobacter inhibens]|uniref:hypothetical protein n=1 Tax=Phaeobacter inhibens TaxID=221822 RepID=UPI000CA0A7D0|nr:hypothetical protein [Phaeobacter inhibens]AUQ92823.1 hypothetical protein PhaeoP24_04265 [Phaeobacter inhibens]
MADRPILFSAPMVNAILREIRTPGAGKTQTRRLLKIKGKPGFFQFGVSDTRGYDWTFRRKDHVWEDFRHDDLMKLLPVQSGDRLFVREHWKACSQMDGIAPRNMSKGEPVFYLADSMVRELGCMMIKPGKHRQAMHMPRWASRITLDVTEVRVQRLQDIDGPDSANEGCQLNHWITGVYPEFDRGVEADNKTLVRKFSELWDSINGTPRKPGGADISWASNPWVMAITFTPYFCNIDQMAKAA